MPGSGLVRPLRTFLAEDAVGGPCSRSQQKEVIKELLKRGVAQFG